MIYLFITILLLLLSLRYDICGKTKGRDLMFYTIMVILVLTSGLRYRLGIDTPNYINHFYHDIPTLDKLTFDDIGFGAKPLWILLNSFVLTIGGRFFIVQLIQSAFVNILLFKYIKRHTCYIFISLFFYYICFYTSFNMVAMKAGMSIVVCLYANDFIIERKWLKGYLLYFIGVLFHPQAIIIMLLPLFLYLKFNKWFVPIAVFLFFVGIEIQSLLGEYIEFLEIDEDIYDKASDAVANDNLTSRTTNQNYLIVNVYPYVIYAIISFLFVKKCDYESNLLKFEPFLVFYVCFYIIGIHVGIAYRFSMYFGIYFVFFMSQLFILFAKGRLLSSSVAIMRSVLIVLPLVLMVLYSRVKGMVYYYPYSSVIEKRIDHKREVARHAVHPYGPSASKKEY